jgi:hypothetical protein
MSGLIVADVIGGEAHYITPSHLATHRDASH